MTGANDRGQGMTGANDRGQGMTRIRRLGTAIVGLVALATVTSAATAAAPSAVTLWLDCPTAGIDARPVANDDRRVSLTAKAPSGAWLADGCGQVDELGTGGDQDAPFDFDVVGDLHGSVDTLTFTFHRLAGDAARVDQELQVDVRLTLDGQSAFGTVLQNFDEFPTVQRDVPATRSVIATATPAIGGLGQAYSVSITDLADVLPAGDDVVRRLHLTVIVAHPNSLLWPTAQQVHAWGAADAPSVIVLDGGVVDARIRAHA